MVLKATGIPNPRPIKIIEDEDVALVLHCLIGKVTHLRLFNFGPHVYIEYTEQQMMEAIVVSMLDDSIRAALFLSIGGDSLLLGVSSLREFANSEGTVFKIDVSFRDLSRQLEIVILRTYDITKNSSRWSINYRECGYPKVLYELERLEVLPLITSKQEMTELEMAELEIAEPEIAEPEITEPEVFEPEIDYVYAMIEEEEQRLMELLVQFDIDENGNQNREECETKAVLEEMLEEIRALRHQISNPDDGTI